MTAKKRERRVRVDADGVRSVRPGGLRLGVWAALLAGLLGCAGAWMASRPGGEAAPEPPVAAAPPAAPDASAAEKAPVRVEPLEARPHPSADSAPVPIPQEAPLPAPSPTEEALEEGGPGFTITPGRKTGLSLYPSPGYKALKRGLVVPEDFDLPVGYVRHYQNTDEGETLPAILMFHPDFEFLDADGEPIELPEDGVVPPELAPEGLPIEMLDPPEQGIDDGP